MNNDWVLTGDRLLDLFPSLVKLFPSLAKVAGKAAGAEIALEFKQKLLEDPTPLQTIMSAYRKLIDEAKKVRKPGDPWPVIIIDEANVLSKWEDVNSLEALLRFFVYLTKQEQLAHGTPPRLAALITRVASFDSRSDPRDQRHVSAAVARQGRVGTN
jgi:AAA+ ATPase superfamily predicted ATPase